MHFGSSELIMQTVLQLKPIEFLISLPLISDPISIFFQSNSKIVMAISKLIAMLFLLFLLARTPTATIGSSLPIAPAESPLPSISPIGSPDSYQPQPRPRQSTEICDRQCDDSVSECVVDSCLHIPAGRDQADCIDDCVQGLDNCRYDCKLASDDGINRP